MNTEKLILELDREIAALQQARDLLLSNTDHHATTRIARTAKTKTKRTLSPEARQRIADAQKRRWAAAKKAAKTGR